MTEISKEHKPTVGPSGRKIVYDENGKPCRSCNTLLDFKMANLGSKSVSSSNSKSSGGGFASLAAAGVAASSATASSAESAYPKDCPPDVNELGRSTWTFLHSVAASYPAKPSEQEQTNMKTFIGLFANIYPCWFCAKDFQTYISKEETKPKVKTQEEFGRWLCDAHNEVNVKIGKPKFDCNLWRQRWKDGWEDGRCD